MPSLIAYRKAISRETTIALRLPLDATQGQATAQELATLPDGRTVVMLPDGLTLPADQPAEVASTIEHLTPLPADVREQIKAASPHVALIAQRMVQMIRDAYSLDDEMYFARIGVGAATGMYTPTSGELQEMTVFGERVESVRQWGRTERAKLGL
jgi:hypothetical protein